MTDLEKRIERIESAIMYIIGPGWNLMHKDYIITDLITDDEEHRKRLVEIAEKRLRGDD